MTRRDALALPLAAPLLAGAAPPGADRIDALVDDAMKRWPAPGFAGAVVRGGKLVWLGARGRLRRDRPEAVTPQTPFPLASCSKGFAAALAALAVADGKLAWDDPVRKHLPGLTLSTDAAVQNATLRDALSHRSGFGAHDFLWFRAPWDVSETLRRAAFVPPVAAPGREYHYTSVAFAAAAEAVAAACGAAWADLVRDRLAKPLGMRSLTTTGRDFLAAPGRAHGHRRTRTGVESMPHWTPDGCNPAGTLAASAADLAPWLTFLLGGRFGELFRPQVRQPVTAELAAQFPLSRAVHYGLGWVLFDYRGEAVAAHGGIADGFRSQLLLVPRLGMGMAFLNNLHDNRMNQALAQTLLDDELGSAGVDWHAYFARTEPPAGRPEPPPRRDPGRPLAGYAGTYRDPAYGDAAVTADGDALRWRWSSFDDRLVPVGGDTFAVAGGYFDGRTLTVGERSLTPPAGVACVFRRA